MASGHLHPSSQESRLSHGILSSSLCSCSRCLDWRLQPLGSIDTEISVLSFHWHQPLEGGNPGKQIAQIFLFEKKQKQALQPPPPLSLPLCLYPVLRAVLCIPIFLVSPSLSLSVISLSLTLRCTCSSAFPCFLSQLTCPASSLFLTPPLYFCVSLHLRCLPSPPQLLSSPAWSPVLPGNSSCPTLSLCCCCLVTTLCDPTDSSPPGSSVHGLLQARTLEWVAMPFSRGIFLTQGSDPHLLHWQVDSSPLSRQGSYPVTKEGKIKLETSPFYVKAVSPERPLFSTFTCRGLRTALPRRAFPPAGASGTATGCSRTLSCLLRVSFMKRLLGSSSTGLMRVLNSMFSQVVTPQQH